jgi:hypothetical protein
LCGINQTYGTKKKWRDLFQIRKNLSSKNLKLKIEGEISNRALNLWYIYPKKVSNLFLQNSIVSVRQTKKKEKKKEEEKKRKEKRKRQTDWHFI